jgi:dTDP-6-deoxy-L-talose 4-dehydrogenase (NAD+)
MKILVIGNGFIASPIIHNLESEGHQLLIYSRTLKNEISSRQILGDIFSFEDFAKTLSWGPQVIIHTAWVTTYGLYKTDQANYKFAQFTADLARRIASSSVKHLVVLGSGSEYGTQSEACSAGITKLNPENLYAKQKVIAFNSVKELLSNSNVRLTWARIFHPYGPGQDKKRLIPYMIHTLKNGGQIRLDDTSSVLDWVTTRDIASAIHWILHYDTPTEVDIGTTIGSTNVDLLKRLESLLGETSQWKRFVDTSIDKNQVSIIGKNSPLFTSGWRPSDNLESGMKWILGL